MRKRQRKKLLLGEFIPSAVVAEWHASDKVPHRDQCDVTAALTGIAEENGLFSYGFGSENEWFFAFVPTRASRRENADVTSFVHELLASQKDVVRFTVRHFNSPQAARHAYQLLMRDFDTRHPA